MKSLNNLNEITKIENESGNSAFTTDDLYSTHDESWRQTLDGHYQVTLFKLKKSRRYVVRAKFYKDIKIFLLMIYSISYLVFVLPETLVKFYYFNSVVFSSRISELFLIVLYPLKLLYYSSNFLAYLTLVILTRKKKRVVKRRTKF